MNAVELPPEERLVPGDLIATLAERTPAVGPNPTEWPGLTFYRFHAPTAPQWDDVGSLSLCVVAQGRKAVTVDGVRHLYDPFNYLLLNRGLRFTAEILAGSVAKPYLSFVLQIDPAMVRRISADILDRRPRRSTGRCPGRRPTPTSRRWTRTCSARRCAS
ncbi:AraC family transcriptional regulator [Pseudonocardia sp. H11422]|uniref:AraC family transcriptional regulator n=1 Tax=Pseudonocardia sp. H11422 TaxID=2835866 RepID=UPI0027E3A5CB|nr:AraC family transcriptional regulator [Pseudonocardia sp. H11422]